MYNLHKLVIKGKWQLADKDSLQTIAIESDGLRVCSILSIDDRGTIAGNKQGAKEEIAEQLYSDMYDSATLKIKVKEAYDGNEAVQILAKYINKIWDEELQIYYYDPEPEVFEKLKKALENYNGRIYLNDYYDLFYDKHDIERPIKEIMKFEGFKMENLIEDSNVSFTYFLTALVERLLIG